MANILTINNNEKDFNIEDILDSEIIVIEDIQGSKLLVNYNNEFFFRSKSVNSDNLNIIDLAIQTFYKKAIDYFNDLPDRVKSLLPKEWWFCFEYFPDNQPANIEYNRTPKNNLILTSICKSGKFKYSFDEIDEYSRLLDVDMIPIIFKGVLNDTNKEIIKSFLNTSEKDLDYIFGESSFSYFFYKLLNPQLQNSFLMDNDFQKNMEKIIIKSESNDDVTFQILNPMYKKINSNSTEYVEVYSLILVNFLSFCQGFDLKDLKIKGEKRDECYIFIICKLFNLYIGEVKNDILNFDIIIPEFFDKDKFRINKEYIKNKLTKEYINENKKFEYIFKILLSSFNKKRTKPIGIFTEGTVVLFNKFVDEINKTIDFFLKKKSEMDLTNQGLVDFSSFFSIKYDKDSEEKVYIQDYYDEMDRNSNKKKGFKDGINKK